MTVDPLGDSLRKATLTRRQALRQLGIGGLALAAPAALAACGSDNDGGGTSTSTSTAKTSSAQIDHFTWTALEIVSLDVAKGGDPAHISMVTEPVLKYDDGLNVVGHLAEKWRAADDTTYVYTVRQGVKFTDGTPVTAEDVAYAISRHKDPKTASQYAGLIPPLDFIKVTGPNEVTVKLKKPNATWSYVPTYFLVAPKAFFTEQGKDYGALQKGSVLGSGPFTLDKAGPTGLEMTANPSYWGKRPFAKTLSIKILRDAETRVLAMQSGDIDATPDLQGAAVPRYRQISDVTVLLKPSARFSFFSFDVEQKPWDDVHVRRAIAYSIDYDGVINAVYNGGAAVAGAIVPRAAFGGVSKEKLDEIFAKVPQYTFNLDKAKAELAQSAYPNGFSDKVWYYNGETSEKLCISLQENLRKIGIKLKLEVPTDEEGGAREDQHRDLGFHLNGWGDSNDPIEMPFQILLSSAATKLQYNEANYKSPEMDKLINENISSTDPEARLRTIGEIMRINNEELPYLPLFSLTSQLAIKNEFVYTGYSPNFGRQMWTEHIAAKA